MTDTPDPVAMLAALRAQGWRKVEVVVTGKTIRVIVEDETQPPKHEFRARK